MTFSEGTVRASRCLDYRKKTEGYEVTHILSGRKFLISDPAKDILELLEKPKDYGILSAELSYYYDEALVEATLSKLHANGMLVGEDEDETFHLRKTDFQLFGVEDYVPGRSDRRQSVLAGIPFGDGNTMDRQCADFSIFLRRYCHNYLSTLNARINQVDFRFLGAPNENFVGLRKAFSAGDIVDAGDLYVHNTEFSSSIYGKIERLTQEITAAGDVSVLLGGDHSISYPAIKGVAANHPRLQIVQFDAHVDTYANRIGNIYTSNERAPHHHGNFLSRVLDLPQIEHVYQYGIRGCFNMRTRNHKRCSIFWAHELEGVLADSTPSPLLEDVPVYLTFDIDFFDPGIAPGTATPVAEGASYKQGMDLLRKVLANHNVVGVDLVEVNPHRDKGEQTMQLATATLLNIINQVNSTSHE
ncbi:hypothetical protein FUA23_14355 [Neolewinella aurantiaca]|uniref:Agmatinase n=1 Tax=Neolewinella aurantiaca TaxID=2602767 RepID=A0A5C7FQY1_9BACT|nr:arginase family protein [Neolewinella aurantiaca]TXF88464.1 hypothetical protein FUA23_14355 [Neolewinella aurantiaca]